MVKRIFRNHRFQFAAQVILILWGINMLMECQEPHFYPHGPESAQLQQYQPSPPFLDSFPFVVNKDLKYTIYLKNDTITYLLVVNASDTIEIGTFNWDEGHLKSVFYPDGDSSTCIAINSNEYLLSIPHNNGWSQLIKVQQKDGQWKIDRDKDNWLTSEAGFVYIPGSQIVAYPNFRATYSGKVTYWQYVEGTGKFKFLRAVETEDCLSAEIDADCVQEIVKNIK